MISAGWLYRLDDEQDPWFGEDKVTHFGWAAATFAHGFIHAGLGRGSLELAIGGLLVELVEAVRYQVYAKKGFPSPWPFLCDKVSMKDLLWDALGGLVMWLLIR